MKLAALALFCITAHAQTLTATFYPEQTISVPATGQPITILRVDIICTATPCSHINPIEVFRTYPSLNPMTLEMARVQLALKTSRSAIQVVGRVFTAGASASAVVTGVQTLIQAGKPQNDTKSSAKWTLVSAGAAFISQYAPALGRQIVGEAPVYSVPDDTLSSRPFDLAAGEAATVHVVSWGERFASATGTVRQ